MSNMPFKETTRTGVIRLLQILSNHEVKCALEVQTGDINDPFIAVWENVIHVDAFDLLKNSEALSVKIGDTTMSFMIDACKYAYAMLDNQINLSIRSKNNVMTRIYSGIVPPLGVIEASCIHPKY